MPLTDSIFAFEEPGGLLVTRTAKGVLIDGIYQPGTTSTFTIRAAVQPAREIARVTAGRDMIEREQGQQVYDVRLLHTNTEVTNGNKTLDADMITYEGDQWTVIRCEPWNFRLAAFGVNDKFWQVIITRTMEGGR